jgi:DNA-binding protein H-NS
MAMPPLVTESLSDSTPQTTNSPRKHSAAPGIMPTRLLSWRSDPKTSFSDWAIEVVVTDAESIAPVQRVKQPKPVPQMYHCHSNVLAWGPRKSEHLVILFQERLSLATQNGFFHPSQMETTRLELTSMQARAFPILLDFMYCKTQVPLSADNACALYLLAEKLVIPTLQRAIQTYVETALSVPQTIEFIAHAQQYAPQSDQLVFSADSKLCGFLVKHPEEAAHVPPHALLQILTVRQQCIKVLKGEDPRQYSGEWETQRSRLLSQVVSECVWHHHHRHHKDNNLKDDDSDKIKADHHQNDTTTNMILTRPLFDKLTHKQHLPALEAAAALKLLKVDALLREEDEDEEDEIDHAKEDEENDNNKEQDPAAANNIGSTNKFFPPDTKKKKKKKKKKSSKPFQFTCLQKRGLKALKKDWREIIQNCSNSQESSSDNDAVSFPYLSETLQTYAPHVLTELLVQISKDYEERLVTTQRVARRTHSILNSSTSELLRPAMADNSEDGTLLKQRNTPLFSCVDREDYWSTDVGEYSR